VPKHRIATYADLVGDEREPLREFTVDGPKMERNAGEHPELAYRRGYQQGSARNGARNLPCSRRAVAR
jgi:hypothetical protein